MTMTEEEIKYHKERIRKRRKRIQRNRKIKKAILKFIFHYIVPVLLVIIGIVVPIILPMDYYFNGTYYDIKKALISIIVIFIPCSAIIAFLLYKWNKFLRENDIIK